ncbi:MAG: SDR family oxidoreductase [Microthrixaceae bacterium]|nr:SDR family oxidoreductase [Microthrixaceae bacterium]MCO5318121.1 SDR family oxidoreductase [Microthrixaceae bacterium]
MQRFEDKVVLITGAASGIGEATALRLAAEGATLALSDLNSEGLAETVEACTDLGAVVSSEVVNVADEPSVVAMVKGAVEHHGRLDVVVNVAGILQFGHTHETSLADFQRIIGVNLTGTFLVCREAIPHLLDTGGNIVNTASTAALAGHPWTISYSASKGGVAALTQTIAVEYGKQGLRANAVAPGSILTPIQNEFQLPEGADAKLVHRIMALDEQRGPEVVASAIAFLGSEDAVHVNGTMLKVDGGTLA